MSARPIFIGGTSSNAGKSWMVTAICAWLRSRGVSVAPFKAQNMSNNSYPCAAGGEIGRAQVAQAEACGLEPEPAMNPILLKPSGNGISQVDRPRTGVEDAERSRILPRTRRTAARTCWTAYHDLARRFDVVVIEGAGSVSELNLRAARPGEPRGWSPPCTRRGCWSPTSSAAVCSRRSSAQHTCSSAEERALFRGFMINKFRGDVSLFDDGVPALEALTASRCFGVFPYADDIHLDAEDSLALETRRERRRRRARESQSSDCPICRTRQTSGC